MPPIPVEADAPPDLVTPCTASAAASASMGAALEFCRRRHRAVEQIEIGEIAREQRGIGKPDIFVVGRDARHRHRALGKFCDAVAADIVSGDHRLPPSDQHAQADIVTLGAFGFLDAAVADFDTLRNPAHRDRVGGIGAGMFGGLHQAMRQCAKRRLIEQAGGRRFLRRRNGRW